MLDFFMKQLNIFSSTLSSRLDESGGEFLFYRLFSFIGIWLKMLFLFSKSEMEKIFLKNFQKHPPRIISYFKQVKGLLIFFSKTPPFFRFSVQSSEGYIKIF